MKIWMKYKKATKHTFVFEQCDEMGNPVENLQAQIPSLYIRKHAIEGPLQHITVEVQPGIALENTDA